MNKSQRRDNWFKKRKKNIRDMKDYLGHYYDNFVSDWKERKRLRNVISGDKHCRSEVFEKDPCFSSKKYKDRKQDIKMKDDMADE
jgi:hypothetical protein